MATVAAPPEKPALAPDGLLHNTLSPSTTKSTDAKRRLSLRQNVYVTSKRASNFLTSQKSLSLRKPGVNRFQMEADDTLSFHIFSTGPSYYRRKGHKHKSYTLSREGPHKPEYLASWPHSSFGLSRRDFVIQRESESGPVVGEVKFGGMFSSTKIILPGLEPGSPADSGNMTPDGLKLGKNRVTFRGKDWYWKTISSDERAASITEVEALQDAWRCEDSEGRLRAVLKRLEGPEEVGTLEILREHERREVEGFITTAMALFAAADKKSLKDDDD